MILNMGYNGSSMVMVDTKTHLQIEIKFDGSPALWKFNDAEDEAIVADDDNFFIIDLKKFSIKKFRIPGLIQTLQQGSISDRSVFFLSVHSTRIPS